MAEAGEGPFVHTAEYPDVDFHPDYEGMGMPPKVDPEHTYHNIPHPLHKEILKTAVHIRFNLKGALRAMVGENQIAVTVHKWKSVLTTPQHVHVYKVHYSGACNLLGYAKEWVRLDVVLDSLLEMLPADVHIQFKKGHQVLYENQDFTWGADEDGHYRMSWAGLNPMSLWQEVGYWADWVEVLVRWPSPIYDDAPPFIAPNGDVGTFYVYSVGGPCEGYLVENNTKMVQRLRQAGILSNWETLGVYGPTTKLASGTAPLGPQHCT